MGLVNQKLIVSLVFDITLLAALFENKHRTFSIVHEAATVVSPRTEIFEQVSQAARKAPLDIR